ATLEPLQISRECVFWPINNSQVLASANFHCRLYESFCSSGHKVPWFYDHALTASRSQFLPPCNSPFLIGRLCEVYDLKWRCQQKFRVCLANARQNLHMPQVILGAVYGTMSCKQVKRRKLKVSK